MAKKKNRKPKAESPIVKVEVPNPDWRPAHDGEKGFPRNIMADKNTKESAVETLFARGFLAKAQKEAADRFRIYWEKAGGTVASLDYSMDQVDGGTGDPIAGRLLAAQELDRARKLIGLRGYEVLTAVCGQGHALTEMSPHKRDRLTMADNLRADLDDLAVMWGIQVRRYKVA